MCKIHRENFIKIECDVLAQLFDKFVRVFLRALTSRCSGQDTFTAKIFVRISGSFKKKTKKKPHYLF